MQWIGNICQCSIFTLLNSLSLLFFLLFSCVVLCLCHSTSLSHPSTFQILAWTTKLLMYTPSSVYYQLINLSSLKSFLINHRRYKRINGELVSSGTLWSSGCFFLLQINLLKEGLSAFWIVVVHFLPLTGLIYKLGKSH